MSLASGTQLGRYEIRSQLGAGGMGEVYRARDTQLGRDVALKVLPSSYSTNEDRLRRFQQEARAASALNHPNIVVVYDVGSHNGLPYVVSELLEGNTLRERVSGSALPQRRALDYAIQIARGLAAAHDKRIVHRDLKPDNIFITEDDRAKILDFGLAKLLETDTENLAQTDVPTRKVQTNAGAVMGTVGYMSPEQVRGTTVDHRSDIFAFGTVLYEMISGQRAFQGDSPVETLNAILKEEPRQLTRTNGDVNPAVERIVWHCLEKNPDRRFQSASDVAFALENISSTWSSSGLSVTPAPPRARNRERLAWIAVVALLFIALSVVLIRGFRKTQNQASAIRFPIVTEEGVIPFADVETHIMSVSPDGKYVAFVAYSGGQRMLWLRALSALTAQTLPGTEGAIAVFWSPDSAHVAFFADDKLKRIDISGKSLQTICALPAPGDATGTWGPDGTIVFSEEEGDCNMYRVPASGGAPTLFLKGDREQRRWVHFLPDGKRVLFYRYDKQEERRGIYVASLDSADTRLVVPTRPTRPQYVQGGYLLYPREGSLVAQRVDDQNLSLSGEPVVVVERLPFFDKTGWAEFSASQTGVLVHMTAFPKTRLLWVDHTGREVGQVGEAGDIFQVRLSLDGQRAALTTGDPLLGSSDVWIQDLTRNTRTRFVAGDSDDGGPVWSPDGTRLAYFSCCEDPSTLHIKETRDSGKREVPIKDQPFIGPFDWSRDGRFILYKNGNDVWVLPLSEGAKPYILLKSSSEISDARFSPDGRWVAFVSAETGRDEVYVTRFDRSDEKFRVSTNGGNSPRWRRDGAEIFYRSADLRIMVARIKSSEKFEAGTPESLFKSDPLSFDYDVSPDGQRFIFVAAAPGTQPGPFTVILDWTSDLKK